MDWIEKSFINFHNNYLNIFAREKEDRKTVWRAAAYSSNIFICP